MLLLDSSLAKANLDERALNCRADIYLQLLEGPERAIGAAYSRIARDDRHLDIHRRFCTPAAERLFPKWATRDDPARSWMWTQDEVAGGTVARASRDQLLAVFARVAAEPPDA